MLPFSFVEMFFFLSLGITFVLILLIVYHFKQRISTMEHKCDTMFDIVQNLAKEVSGIKQTTQMPAMDIGGSAMFIPPHHMFMQQHPTMDVEFQMSEVGPSNLESVVEELAEETDAEDQDDDDDETSDESDSDDDSYSSASIMDTGEENEIDLEDINKCKIDQPNTQCGIEAQEETFEKIKVTEDEILITTTEQEPRLERQISLVEETPEELPAEPTEVVVQKDYTKLSLNELKKLVASKGIQGKDVSKLKRQELLKWLQDSA